MINREISSFRDPAGYIYYDNDKVIRRINKIYFHQYDHFMHSGLYDELITNNYLIPHKEIKRTDDYILLEVTKIPFISYPYEWCHNELKDAALLTLNIQTIALKYNMILKDASAYNVQFYQGKPIFIDTLSFDFYIEGTPWGAYGQFTRHFIAPLLLNTYVDQRSSHLLSNYIDGFPLDLANNILKNRGGFTAKMHIKWHSKSIAKYNNSNKSSKEVTISKSNIINLNQMMINQISKLTIKKQLTEWDNYYNLTNYDEYSKRHKIKLVNDYLKQIQFNDNSLIFDLGSNDGEYSKIASKYCQNIISFDIDNNCVNRNYLNNQENSHILPLVLDLTNPSSAIGFGNMERKSITERGHAKCIMSLALIHHLVISNNLPFTSVASWFRALGEYLIIEFVPKTDSMVIKLLSTRKDIFDKYNETEFETKFQKYYEIITKEKIKNSERTLYLMKIKRD